MRGQRVEFMEHEKGGRDKGREVEGWREGKPGERPVGRASAQKECSWWQALVQAAALRRTAMHSGAQSKPLISHRYRQWLHHLCPLISRVRPTDKTSHCQQWKGNVNSSKKSMNVGKKEYGEG